MKRTAVVSLMTDFGLQDPYVGIMKGVMLAINPQLTFVDLTHLVEPADLYAAAAMLLEAYPFFAPGTVHLVVVDPGVGSLRRPMIVKAAKHLFVGPDNGVFYPLIESQPRAELFHIRSLPGATAGASATFHGRDIFAPAAAHLSLGVPPAHLGEPLDDPVTMSLPQPEVRGACLAGVVLRVDRFGNLITNIPKGRLKDFISHADACVEVGELRLKGLRRTYSDVPQGTALALIGSSGFLEIAVNGGRACDLLGMPPKGCPVVVSKD